ncbi:hypothetical protein [Saprospira grandis]|uniref:Uncharacterized protein n=1 Tax=Saprospira grandis (strain Lewin) TaxID=984262 RepID=H6L6J2_SAPGL|nr:hypothetical protein [Saprospira grandis]AFC24134.1 hypothetical protein SGRA_1399 [Saprospira grandis str. Lewin]
MDNIDGLIEEENIERSGSLFLCEEFGGGWLDLITEQQLDEISKMNWLETISLTVYEENESILYLLDRLPQIKYLILTGFTEIPLSRASFPSELETLDISYLETTTEDISFVEDLGTLKKLHLSFSRIDFKAIQQSAIESLSLRSSVKNFEEIIELDKLKELEIRSLPSLKDWYICLPDTLERFSASCYMYVDSIPFLDRLPNLREIDLSIGGGGRINLDFCREIHHLRFLKKLSCYNIPLSLIRLDKLNLKSLSLFGTVDRDGTTSTDLSNLKCENLERLEICDCSPLVLGPCISKKKGLKKIIYPC